VLTADEEVGCIGSKRLIATDSLRPQRLVVGEPTSSRRARRKRLLPRADHYPWQGGTQRTSCAGRIRYLWPRRTDFCTRRAGSSARNRRHHEPLRASIYNAECGHDRGRFSKEHIPGRADMLVSGDRPGLSPDRVPTAIRAMIGIWRDDIRDCADHWTFSGSRQVSRPLRIAL